MLVCIEKERLFSSYVGKNIYKINMNPVTSRFGRMCELQYIWDNEVYNFDMIDFYENDISEKHRKSIIENWQICFGGRNDIDCYIYPSDYIYKFGSYDEKTTLGLIYNKKNFENKVKINSILNEKNIAFIFNQIFIAIKALHEDGMCLNGIDINQIWYSTVENRVYMQITQNCISTNGEIGSYINNISDNSKGLYHEKIYSIPEYCSWSKLKLSRYAQCNDVYSVATIMFQYLMDRHPLNGKLCDDQEDDFGRMEIYSRYPCFIFNETDDQNCIGNFDSEQVTINKWENLNPKLKKLYNQLYAFPDFNEKDVEEKSKRMDCFNIASWLDCLNNM